MAVAYYLLPSCGMAIYRVTRPLAAFEPESKRAFTIPSALIRKEILVEALDLTSVEWSEGTVWVPIQDFIERSERFD